MTERGRIEWEKLRDPIPEDELERVVKYGGVELTYANANAVQKRLDDVVGPANWQMQTTLQWDGDCPVVHCVIAIRDQGGEWIPRGDYGYPNNVQRDPGVRVRKNDKGVEKPVLDGPVRVEDSEAVKSATTDALRRAAWRWGIGWELHEKRGGGAQTSQESRSAASGGDDASRGNCPVHTDRAFQHRVGTSGGGKDYDFWACPHFDTDAEGKRIFCQQKPPKAAVHGDDKDDGGEKEARQAILKIVSEALVKAGTKTEAQRLQALAHFRSEQGDSPPASIKALDEMTVDSLVAFADWLGGGGR